MTELKEERCDIRVWSGECEHPSETTGEESYLCALCEKIPDLDHEVKHDSIPPYLSGDYDNLS